jgi:SMC interacting uncharacterized protein involved in chromosome segregation
LGKEGVGQSTEREIELSTRVLSLLHINAESENTIEALHRKIRSLQAQCNGLKKQLRDRREHFEAALQEKDKADKLVDDLKAENRTMRVVIRGFGLTNVDRIDDLLS